MQQKLKLLTLATMTVTAAACSGSSTPPATSSPPAPAAVPTNPDAIEFADFKAFIEYNGADDDIGFHVEFDADPWAGAILYGPDGSKLFDLGSDAALNDHGLSGNFFESAEYPPDEVSREEFFARFPEGVYTLIGESIDGEPLESTGSFIHLIPDPPMVVAPGEGAEVDLSSDVTIAWEPVTTPGGVEIEVYTVQVAPVDPPEGEPPIDLNIDLIFEVPANVGEVRIPSELFAPGNEYEFELMAVDAGGNQTFAVGTFATAG